MHLEVDAQTSHLLTSSYANENLFMPVVMKVDVKLTFRFAGETGALEPVPQEVRPP